jgi:hypothetical protein
MVDVGAAMLVIAAIGIVVFVVALLYWVGLVESEGSDKPDDRKK